MAPVYIGLKAFLMQKKFHFHLKNQLAVCFFLCLSSVASHSAAAEIKPSAVVVTRWTCNAFYLPARSIWQRAVAIEFDGDDVRAVQIDGVSVFAFNIQGTTVLTAVDGERIQFDPTIQTWSSDLRGIVSSQGNCLASQ